MLKGGAQLCGRREDLVCEKEVTNTGIYRENTHNHSEVQYTYIP